MRLVVLGATGGIGRHVVTQALAAGHEVIALVRDPSAVPGSADTLDVRKADVLDQGVLTAELAEINPDAVISALGVRPPVKGPVSLLTDAMGALIPAMRSTGIRRLLVVSAAGAYDEEADGPVTRYVAKPLLKRLLRYGFDDTRAADALVEATDLDWTIVRPPRLLDKPLTTRYRVGGDHGLKKALNIHRADVAHYLLRALGERGTHRRARVIAI
ncbi:NADH-flavin reductase [Actinorhabdospora filicis]|uniref:NADH-flavin reductase n=1 Tax=Actinorhabdospora filicis TaxID=1785913 RepID=A0A9W6WC49_9ACTN|nr:NAD(P)H-binding protein [Actinorhabdospora filicis]GLZ79400.1 NADH-flavin reductase [Actinorhabdospora filicis]